MSKEAVTKAAVGCRIQEYKSSIEFRTHTAGFYLTQHYVETRIEIKHSSSKIGRFKGVTSELRDIN